MPPTDGTLRLGQFYRLYARWLGQRLAPALRRSNLDPDDLVQEAFLRAAPHIASGDVRHPRAFLLRIALNLACDWRRRPERRVILIALPEPSNDTALPDGLVSAPEQGAALSLRQAIEALPPAQRDVFLLSRFGGLSYAQIARQCGISVGAVEKRMTKALLLLDQSLHR